MGDITELGNIVAGAFAHPDEAAMASICHSCDFLSFMNYDTFNDRGHKFSFKQVPKEVFAALSWGD